MILHEHEPEFMYIAGEIINELYDIFDILEDIIYFNNNDMDMEIIIDTVNLEYHYTDLTNDTSKNDLYNLYSNWEVIN